MCLRVGCASQGKPERIWIITTIFFYEVLIKYYIYDAIKQNESELAKKQQLGFHVHCMPQLQSYIYYTENSIKIKHTVPEI